MDTKQITGGNREALMRARVRKQANRASRPVLVGEALQAQEARKDAERQEWLRQQEQNAAAARRSSRDWY